MVKKMPAAKPKKLGVKKTSLKNLNTEQLDKFIRENLQVEQLVEIFIILNGKKYSETVSVARLLKVYERAVKGEPILSPRLPEMLESLREKILKDIHG